jgi:phage-related protein
MTEAPISKTADKPLLWCGSTLEELSEFPDDVKRVLGFALRMAQKGSKHPDAKPLRGFGGASVLEVVEDHDGDTYRAVYTVKYADAVYVLHVFKKKSKRGVKTPKHDIDLIKQRLRDVEQQRAKASKEKRS